VKVRKKLSVALMACLLPLSAQGAQTPDTQELLRELQALKAKLNQLERELHEKNAKEEEVAKEVKEIKETLNRVQFGGNAVIYYQGASVGKLNGEEVSNPNGAGFVANLELTAKVTEGGQLYGRAHAGEGTGADGNGVADALFANLNTLSDDNPGNDSFSLLELYYQQELLNGRLNLIVGKTEPFILIDTNEFANDEVSQFVGKPFVNNPMIDPEDHFAPMVGVDFALTDSLSFQGVAQSNTEGRVYWNGSSWETKEKDAYSNVFDKPVLAGQITYTAQLNGLEGHYRLYVWNDRADLIKVGQDDQNPKKKPETAKALCVGVSIDQWLTPKLGVFARAAVGNSVYPDQQFYSLGFVYKGLLPEREKDLFAFGAAAALPNREATYKSPEWHFETYYKIAVSDNLFVTPDLQVVLNPGGNSDNDPIVAGTVKAELTF
jgi:hypothetical protein